MENSIIQIRNTIQSNKNLVAIRKLNLLILTSHLLSTLGYKIQLIQVKASKSRVINQLFTANIKDNPAKNKKNL